MNEIRNVSSVNSERIKHRHFESAEEFVLAISPHGSIFKNSYEPRGWLFRGHSDDEYPLIPSALREQVRLMINREWYLGPRRQNRAQIQGELELLASFFENVNLAGLPIPEDSQSLRHMLDDWQRKVGRTETKSCEWPPVEFISLLALARHYGVPTRLLDWSFNSFTAAYFAAEEAARRLVDGQITPGNLCVWGLSQIDCHTVRILKPLTGAPLEILITNAPRATNPRLNAQDGTFTLVRYTIELDEDQEIHPLDEIVSGIWPVGGLWHFTMPKTQARKLLWLLAKVGVTGRAINPGYEGAAQSLFERRYWPSSTELFPIG